MTLDYQTPSPPARRTISIVRICGALLLASAVVWLVGSIFFVNRSKGGVASNYLQCAFNVRQIGQAIALYASDHDGLYPDTFSRLIQTEDITPEVFVCPSSNDTKLLVDCSNPATTKRIADNDELASGGHCSYIYVGAGLYDQSCLNPPTQPNTARSIVAAKNTKVTNDAVVAYEPVTSHGLDGSNILFGDGRVEYFPALQIQQLEADRAGHVWPLFVRKLPAAK